MSVVVGVSEDMFRLMPAGGLRDLGTDVEEGPSS